MWEAIGAVRRGDRLMPLRESEETTADRALAARPHRAMAGAQRRAGRLTGRVA